MRATGDLLIRDISPETHAELKRRAQDAGVSLQSYVARLLERSTAVPAVTDWLDQLEQLPRHRDLSGAAAVREARDELLRRLATPDVRRIPITGALLDAAWRLRDSIAARDALYVAAARDLGCMLLTTDGRLARAVPDPAVRHAE